MLINISKTFLRNIQLYISIRKHCSIADKINISGKEFNIDHMTNVTPRILELMKRKLHLKKSHPLNLVQRWIVSFMYSHYINSRGNPLFSVHADLEPIVTVEQNFDSLLVPSDHVSRQKRDNYYINEQYLLRAHTTAHQSELVKMGLDNFLMVGDVYRRDEIDSSHYPVFHQLDAVRLLNTHEILGNSPNASNKNVFENCEETKNRQNCHSEEAVSYITRDLRLCLTSLAKSLFGNDVEYRWVDAYFPFTHPSWELEVMLGGRWTEILGCGVIQQQILVRSGAGEKVGWAYGLGLERIAMKLFGIPDIRLFWSEDDRFLSQFRISDVQDPVTFKPFSSHPPCICDLSFWVPNDAEMFSPQDFYELVRDIAGNVAEKVELLDEFRHPQTGQVSHCYRIVYRSWEKGLTQKEANEIHDQITRKCVSAFGVKIR